MADITLISGSTLGSAECVAEHLAEKLEEAGYSTEIQHGPLRGRSAGARDLVNYLFHHGAATLPTTGIPL